MNLKNRSIISADAPRLTELDKICFPPDVAYETAYFIELIESSSIQGILLEDDNDFLVGFILWSRWKRGVGHLITIDIEPDFRKQGIGRMLMAQMDQDCRNLEATGIMLEVSVTNSGAMEFYRKLGYHEVALLDDYYGKDRHAHLMMAVL